MMRLRKAWLIATFSLLILAPNGQRRVRVGDWEYRQDLQKGQPAMEEWTVKRVSFAHIARSVYHPPWTARAEGE